MVNDEWGDALTLDHPGLSDMASGVRASSTQVEVNVSASRVGEDPFAVSLGVLGRYGLWDGLELRLDVPSFDFVFERNAIQTRFRSIELGAKWGFDLEEVGRFALMPFLVAPTLYSNSSIASLGGGLGILFDWNFFRTLSLTLNATPRLLPVTVLLPGDEEGTTEWRLNALFSAQLKVDLSGRLQTFLEGWAQYTGSQTPPMSYGAGTGLVIYISPEMALSASLGVAQRGESLGLQGGINYGIRLF